MRSFHLEPYHLRNARPADLDAIMALERSGFEEGIVESPESFAARLNRFSEGFLLAGDPPWGYLCAEIWDILDDDPARFELGHAIEEYLAPQGSILYIASMTVSPDYRGQGRGRALFRSAVSQLEARFPVVKRTVLIVNEHWNHASKIYRDEGFQHVSTLLRFFQPTDGPEGDALVFEREVYKNINMMH